MGGGAMFNFEQLEFRGRNDNGSQVTATWKANANVNWTQPVDENFRVRFVGQEIGGATGATDMQLQYQLNGGGWNNVTTTSSVVQAVSSPNVTDGTATTNLIGGTGTFAAGTISTDGLAASVSLAASGHTEWEFVLQILGADVGNNDTVELRGTYSGDNTPNYTNSPSITVEEAAPPAVTGTGAVSTPAPTASGSASEAFIASGGGAVPTPTVSGSGTHTESPSFTGTASVTAHAPTVSASGTHTIPAVTGAASVVAGAPQAAATSSLRFLGTGNASVLGPEASGSGGVLIPIAGEASVSVPPPTASGVGVYGTAFVGAASVAVPQPSGSADGLLGFIGVGVASVASPTAAATGAWELDIIGAGQATAQAPRVSGAGVGGTPTGPGIEPVDGLTASVVVAQARMGQVVVQAGPRASIRTVEEP